MLQPIFRIFKRVLPASVKSKILRSDKAPILALRGIASHPSLLAGKLSVVVPVYNVEEHLDECLASLQDQNYPNLEILIIDDGSLDASATIAEKYVSADKRFKLIQQRNQGLGAARNTGIRHATGDFITFVDSDDVVPKNAYLAMIESLHNSGSDFVVGAIERLTTVGTRRDHWAARVHASDRQGITLDDLPEMTKNVFACNKVFRKDFFDQIVKQFPTGVYYEDQAPTARAMVQARQFDVLNETTYLWRIREDGSSITQNKIRMKDLNDRSDALFEVQDIYNKHASPAVYRYWLAKTMGMDLSYYFELGPRATDEYWQKLVDTTQRLTEFLDAETWLSIRARQRIPALLVLNNQREKLVQFYGVVQNYRSGLPVTPSKIDVNPIVNPTVLGFDENLFTQEDLTLSNDEYELKAVVFRLEWLSQTQLEVNAFVYLPTHDKNLHSNLIIRAHSAENVVDINVEPLERSLINELEIPFDSFQTYGESAIKFVIDLEAIGATTPGQISLTPQFKSAERTWEAEFTSTTQMRVPTASRPTHFNGQTYYPKLSSGHGFEIEVLCEALIVTDMKANDGRHVNLQFVPNKSVTHARLHERVTGRTVPVRLRTSEDGLLSGSLRIPNMNYKKVGNDPYIWELEYKLAKQPWSVALRGLLSDETYDSVAGGITVSREPHGKFWLQDSPWAGQLQEIDLDPLTNQLTISFKCAGTLASSVHLSLRTRKGLILPSIKSNFDDSTGVLVSTFELLNQEGTNETPKRTIQGWVEICGAASGEKVTKETYPLALNEKGKASSPRMLHSASTTVWVTSRGYKSAAQLRISPRVEPNSLGFAGRFNLISDAKARAFSTGVDERLAVVSSFNGSNAFDGVRPVAQELLRGGHVDRVTWVVSDWTIQVPDGHDKVLLHSEAFVEALHSAKYLINNNNFPHYFEKQEQQIYCQLWHGTPLKKIGEDVPSTSLSYSYRELMKREVAAWDLLIGQSEEATRLLQGAFRYSGRAIATGYPRNDILSDEVSREELRELTRRKLGISPDQYCVLYAPTWRDNLRSTQGYAQVDFLDENLLTSSLGNNSVLLRRGHFNTMKAVSDAFEDSIIDVTQFENLNALIAASDCLVTDYSSIMFDYAVSNKPIFLFAPDRDEYIQQTRGTYYDYDEIAPSTITTTTEELIKAIKNNSDGVSEKQKKFQTRFAPYDDGQATLRVIRELLELSSHSHAE